MKGKGLLIAGLGLLLVLYLKKRSSQQQPTGPTPPGGNNPPDTVFNADGTPPASYPGSVYKSAMPKNIASLNAEEQKHLGINWLSYENSNVTRQQKYNSQFLLLPYGGKMIDFINSYLISIGSLKRYYYQP